MRALLLITWNDLRQSFADRALLLLMFAAPLAIATIISVTFGSLGDESSPVADLPIAIVNADRGSPIADFGSQFADALGARPGPPPAVAPVHPDEAVALLDETAVPVPSLFTGLRAYAAPDEPTARSWLASGRVSAVIILPPDLSRRLAAPAGRGAAEARVVTRPDREISGEIALTLARSMLGGFAGGLGLTQAAVAGVAGAEGVSPQAILSRPEFTELTSGGRDMVSSRVRLEQESLRSGGIGFHPLVAFGATQAIFFALFTANANATSILEEERDGTFIRLLVSPTRKGVVLAGKLVSTGVMVLVQLAMLFVAFTVIGSLIGGQIVFIWGRRVGLILLVLVVTSAAAAGIGGVVAAGSVSPEQSSVIGTVINMFMAITGGAFGFRFASPIRFASAVFWGADAFEELAAGGTDIWTNVGVLAVFAALASVIAYALFLRRFSR